MLAPQLLEYIQQNDVIVQVVHDPARSHSDSYTAHSILYGNGPVKRQRRRKLSSKRLSSCYKTVKVDACRWTNETASTCSVSSPSPPYSRRMTSQTLLSGCNLPTLPFVSLNVGAKAASSNTPFTYNSPYSQSDNLASHKRETIGATTLTMALRSLPPPPLRDTSSSDSVKAVASNASNKTLTSAAALVAQQEEELLRTAPKGTIFGSMNALTMPTRRSSVESQIEEQEDEILSLEDVFAGRRHKRTSTPARLISPHSSFNNSFNAIFSSLNDSCDSLRMPQRRRSGDKTSMSVEDVTVLSREESDYSTYSCSSLHDSEDSFKANRKRDFYTDAENSGAFETGTTNNDNNNNDTTDQEAMDYNDNNCYIVSQGEHGIPYISNSSSPTRLRRANVYQKPSQVLVSEQQQQHNHANNISAILSQLELSEY